MKYYDKPLIEINRALADCIMASGEEGDTYFENELPLVPFE